MNTRVHCTCTVAEREACTGLGIFQERRPDGSCDCPCHSEYADDPENWQPWSVDPQLFDEEFAGLDDLQARIDAAEALIEEPHP